MRIVALYTDFGNKDIYGGLLKASILSNIPEVQLVDMSHNIDKHDIVQGALFIKNAMLFSPPGSIHLAVINSFYNKKVDYIFLEYGSQYFIGPNNGLFSLVLPELKKAEILSIYPEGKTFTHLIKELGSVVKAICDNDLEGFEKAELVQERLSLNPVITESQIRATIIYIDSFGNAITNLDDHTFRTICRNRDFKIYFQRNDPIQTISNNYGEVGVGEVLCFFNTTNYLEIAVNLGNASELFNLKLNETIQIDFI